MEKYSDERMQDIKDTIEYVEMLRAEGLNRLKIWEELVKSGTNKIVILEAFRKTGLFKG